MIISLSHSDMDGVGAQIALTQAFGEITTLNTSYGKVTEYLEIIDDMLLSRPGITEIYVTDLNITETEMKFLRSKADLYPGIEFNYIDHHDYEYEPTTYKSTNLKIMVSKKFCATKLTHLFLRKHKGLQSDKDLDHFVDVVDAYDLWQVQKPLFQEGLRMNELFWDMMARRFYMRFKNIPKMRMIDDEKVDKLLTKKNKLFAKLKTSGRIFEAPNKSVFLCYVDEFRSHITLDFPDFYVYVNMTLYGSASIRLSIKFTDTEAKFMKDSLIEYALTLPGVVSAGGHVHAMGVTTTLQGDNNAIIAMGRALSIKADYLMEQKLKMYQGQGSIAR